MDIVIDAEEARVLGCLLEKEMATPEYYPLSLNALVNACNQKSNRNPVVRYSEGIVTAAIDRLVQKDLMFESRLSRVPKYEELIMRNQNLVSREASILCTLLLRGPQTPGEIKNRTDRLYAFDNLDQVQDTMSDLSAAGYMERCPRQPGQKEDRFAHCLFVFEQVAQQEAREQYLPEQAAPVETKDREDSRMEERVLRLEETVEDQKQEFQQLKQSFEAFKKQFE